MTPMGDSIDRTNGTKVAGMVHGHMYPCGWRHDWGLVLAETKDGSASSARDLAGRRALAARLPPRTRYPTDMEHERTLFTTAEAAAQLGISQNAVQNAIQRGTLEHVAISPRLNMVTRDGIEAYRRAHLGQVGRPPRRKRRTQTAAASAASVTTEHHTGGEGGATHPAEETNDEHDA